MCVVFVCVSSCACVLFVVDCVMLYVLSLCACVVVVCAGC